jgi:hypothetical protein
MAIIDEVTAVLPELQQKAVDEGTGKIFIKEVIRSGYSIDNRPLSRSDIKDMFSNTSEHFLKKGILVKIKIGHFQEGTPFTPGDQELKGFVTRMELREAPREEDNFLSIFSEFYLFPETARSFLDGRFPEVSIGRTGVLTDEQGNDIENIIEHVALLGSERAALPHLRSVIYNLYKSLYKEGKMKIKNVPPEVTYEAIKTIHEVTSAFLSEMRVDGDGDTEKKEKTEEKSNKTMNKTQNTSVEILKKFNELVANGNITHDGQTDFYKLVDKAGIDFAMEFYSTKKVETPALESDEVTSIRDEGKLKDAVSKLKQAGKSLNIPDERMEQYIKEETADGTISE